MSTDGVKNQTYTIMEVAKLSGLSESTLRYYETIGLIDEIKRGTTSKQREYTDDNISMIIAVACLSAMGMSIDNMREYLANRSRGAAAAKEQISLLDKQHVRLTQELHYMQLRQRYVSTKIEYWKAVDNSDDEKMTEMKKRADVIARELKLPRENKKEDA